MSQYNEINAMKLKEKWLHDGEKKKCLVCKSVFNSDYRLKHNSANHQDFVKINKNIPHEVFGALFEFRNKKTKKQ